MVFLSIMSEQADFKNITSQWFDYIRKFNKNILFSTTIYLNQIYLKRNVIYHAHNQLDSLMVNMNQYFMLTHHFKFIL